MDSMTNPRREDTVKIFPVKAKVAIALSATGILLFANPALAARLDVTPEISLDQAYDSNVFNTSADEKGDFSLRTTPAMSFSLATEATRITLRGSSTFITYYKYTERNRYPSVISLGLDATPIRLNPRFSITPTAHFVQVRDPFERTVPVSPEDPLLPASIASETAIRKSRDYGGTLRAGYIVTPNLDFSVGGGFSKRQFLDNAAGGIDSRVVSGDTTLMYRFTPVFSSGVFFRSSSNQFDNGRDSHTVSGGLTGRYLYSPALTVSGRAGVSRVKESDPAAGLPDRTDTAPAVSLSVAYAENDFRASVTGSIDDSGGGSFGRTTRRETLSVFVADRIAPEWTADLRATFQENRSLDDAVSQDLISASGTAGVTYHPAPWANVHLLGSAFRQWSNGADGSDLKRYSAILGFTLGYMVNIY